MIRVIVFVLMRWSLLPNAQWPFQIYCAPPNLGITRTWMCWLNFAQRPIFSGLRFFNESEISDMGPQWCVVLQTDSYNFPLVFKTWLLNILVCLYICVLCWVYVPWSLVWSIGGWWLLFVPCILLWMICLFVQCGICWITAHQFVYSCFVVFINLLWIIVEVEMFSELCFLFCNLFCILVSWMFETFCVFYFLFSSVLCWSFLCYTCSTTK